jgi:hypothetical protein
VRAAALTLAVALLGGCASAPAAPPFADLPALDLAPRLELRLEPAAGDGPARTLRVQALLWPGDGRPLRVVPCRPDDGSALLELSLRWEDHSGAGPGCTGRATQVLVPWSGDLLATDESPWSCAADVALGPVQGVLARRVRAEGRLIGLDLVRDEGHGGGRLLQLPPATLVSLAPAPPGLLEEHLQSGRPDGIFLAAAGAPDAWRAHVLDRLVDALPASRGAAREACFAALFWLTGETHGRDIHRWSTWWIEERNRRAR